LRNSADRDHTQFLSGEEGEAVRPLVFDDPFIVDLAQAIGARTPLEPPVSKAPTSAEVAALCNEARRCWVIEALR
jgi:hypothetical protein